MSLDPVELRHILHGAPEPSFKEFNTTRVIRENISALCSGLDYVKLYQPLETGLVVEYSAAPSPGGPYILLRADIDALKMEERSGSEFSSANGFMHSCGHDVHSAILYGFIRRAVENKVKKNFLFFFQPAEETGGGAGLAMKTGIFDKYNISSAYALHVTDEYDEGVIASAPGVLFASARETDIEFLGRAAHIAFPERGINSLNAARVFFDCCESALTEYKGNLIFGAGRFFSGELRNILPAYAKIEGSIRALSTIYSDEFYGRINGILDDIKKEIGVDFTLKTGSYYPEVSVDKTLFNAARERLSGGRKFMECAHKLTGEDFGFIAKRYPSFMFWLGSRKAGEEAFGLHNPGFFPPDSVIEKGVKIFIDLLL
jgi:N-acetyldiaminopimelate deacetylase